MKAFLAAVIQMQSTSNLEANLDMASTLIGRAGRQGAKLVATPENSNLLAPLSEKLRLAEPLDGPTCERFRALAERHKIHLLLGSFNERNDDDPTHCSNTSVLFEPGGSIISVYRKMHLFDVCVSDTINFRESETITPGSECVVARTALGNIGLSICYDLRFPELYRALVENQATMLTVPSAFTVPTGIDHWEVLLRARAIENQCYVLAPAQCGRHDPDGLRESFGHSMIIDPWGHVIASCGDDRGFAVAELDLRQVSRARERIPALKNRRI